MNSMFHKTNIKHQLTSYGLIAISIIFVLSSCRKFIEIDTPSTSTSTESAFQNDLTAAAVLTGIYSRLAANFTTPSLTGTSFYTELSGDNLILNDPNADLTLKNYYNHTIDQNNYTYWAHTYQQIYALNISIKEMNDANTLTFAVKQRLLGEAYFMRAFCYFYLVNLFGPVPLAIQPEHTVNKVLPRSSEIQIYDQINKDLSMAATLLDYNYKGSDVLLTTTNRLRPNLAAVQALQARIFLYQGRYSEAEAAASLVIGLTNLYSLSPVETAFVKNSSETIWALQPVSIGYNAREAFLYLLKATGPDRSQPAYLSDNLMKSFEAGDNRKVAWTDSVTVTNATSTKTYPYPRKYKQGFVSASTAINEYTIVLRLAEMYLIRAEAKNEMGNSNSAVDDLNTLRDMRRAPISAEVVNPLPALEKVYVKESLRSVIQHERQVELFTEWSHRWFDLKRTGKIDEVMKPVSQARGVTWSSYQALYPIPAGDILLNGKLSQNPGYPN